MEAICLAEKQNDGIQFGIELFLFCLVGQKRIQIPKLLYQTSFNSMGLLSREGTLIFDPTVPF